MVIASVRVRVCVCACECVCVGGGNVNVSVREGGEGGRGGREGERVFPSKSSRETLRSETFSSQMSDQLQKL